MSSKLKLFISQPLRGVDLDKVKAERKRAIGTAKEMYYENIEVIFSHNADTAPDNSTDGLFSLSKSIAVLSTADIVYFCDGWENCKACRIEYDCAFEYGKKIIHS